MPGDWVLAQDESDPDAVPTLRQVEEVFENQAQVMVLGLGGREIETTPEHPFWVRDKGWTAAGEIEPGEELRSHDGQWIPLDSRYITDNLETVYNMRVAEDHTYFVGSPLWGFTVWAHNTYSNRPKDYTKMQYYIPRLKEYPASARLSPGEIHALDENLDFVLSKTVPGVRGLIKSGKSRELATQSLQNQLKLPRWRFIDQIPNGRARIQSILDEYSELVFPH